MPRARTAVEVAGPYGSVRVEHVRTPGTVRLVVGQPSSPRETILELEVGEFLDRLGLMNWPTPAPFVFLIFAGNAGRTAGGAGDFVGSYPTEAAARDAFCAVCEDFSPDWAQLVRVEKGGRLSVVCWRGQSGGRRPVADLAVPRTVGERHEAPAKVLALARPRRPDRARGVAAGGSQ